MAKDDPHFRLRIPADLKTRVAEAAQRNNRSVTAEIVAALEEKYPEEAFDLGAFITSFSASLNEFQTEAEVERLVARANIVLEDNQSDWRIKITSKKGVRHVTFETAADAKRRERGDFK